MTRVIQDVDTGVTSDEPTGWTTPSGGGLHLVSDYIYDDENRLTQVLAPSHTADLSGTATTVRGATWYVYTHSVKPGTVGSNWAEDEDWSGQGYATGTSPSYTYTLVDPVGIQRSDKAGRGVASITSKRSTGSGQLASGNTFSQSDWKSWSVRHYDNSGKVDYTRAYFLIPSSGSGTAGTNYYETDLGYDTMNRVNSVKGPDGTISRTVHDVRGFVASSWVGTDDTGATESDPTGGSASGNNMVKVSENAYDGGSAGGDGLLTSVTNEPGR